MAEWKAEPGMAVDYNNWNTYQQIMDELDLLAARCRSPTNCAVETVGNSLQGRAIKALRMWRTGTNRRTVWVDATIHAREWLATSTHLLFMKHMVDDVNDATVADFINRFDFYFIPVMNPDGYSYSHTNERLWRKNRRTNSGSTCIGVDLNRNYAQMWGNAGAATNPCSETYRGASAGSEPETAVIQAALRSRGPSLLFSMHIHTYGQLWLIPWGSVTSSGACNIASDHNAMMVIANAGANAVQATYGTSWSRGNSCATIYPASGLTMDYSKGVAGVFFTVTPELRGNNFVVNTNQINPAYLETWNGLAATVRAL
jgi:carboxypeptidase A2